MLEPLTSGGKGRIGMQASTPATMRRQNERNLLECLARIRVASRAHLAKAAGLSQPTAGKIINRFIKLGILKEIGKESTSEVKHKIGKKLTRKLGRPGRLLEFDCETPRFIGIYLDVKETAIAMLPFSPFTENGWDIRFPTTNAPNTFKDQLIKHKPAEIPSTIWAVAVSVPGIIDEAIGQVFYSPNLHWTEQINLKNFLREIFQLPVITVQEIRALALGYLKQHNESNDFLLVDVGEGVGGAVVLKGSLYTSSLPLSGELGHTIVPGNPRVCGCGSMGCLETLLSKNGLLESFRAATNNPMATWEEFVSYLKGKTLPDWLIGTLEAAGTVIAGALNVLGVKKVVITGYINELPQSVHEVLSKSIQKATVITKFEKIIYQPAPRYRAAGLIAACIDKWLEHWSERFYIQTSIEF